MKLAKTAVFLTVWVGMAVLAVPAVADSPSSNAYGCQGCSNITTQSTLPFTGLNLALLVLFGVLLLGAGVAVHRSTRAHRD